MSSGPLSPREIRRYEKQILNPDIGITGQEKLKATSVLVVGAGGTGCPALQYLAVAGIGKAGIVESGKVSEPDLQQEILYCSRDLGKLKSIMAEKHLAALNPFIKTEIFNLNIDTSNALDIIRNYDIIIDATENTDSGFIINDSCVILDKPMVYGSTRGHEGVISVFNYQGGPTYRCFMMQQREDYDASDTSQRNFPAVIPGITGCYMGAEVIKIVTGAGEILSGKALIINIFDNLFKTVNINNIPENHDINHLNSSSS